jgi:integrase
MTKTAKRNAVSDGIAFTGKSWSYVLRVPDPTTGRTKPKWVGGFDTQESALLARDEARVALRKRNYVPPTKITVGEYLDRWIETHALRVKPTTLNSYRELINNYLKPRLGSVTVQALKPSDIERFYGELITTPGKAGHNLNPATAVRCVAVLKKALSYAERVEGLIAINPATRVPLPTVKTNRPTPWTLGELNTFLETAKDHRLYFFFRLSAFTGARRGELLALRWSDFDGKAITISKSRTLAGKSVVEQNSTKGGKGGQRRVALDPETIELFTAHRKRQLEERLVMGSSWTETGYVFVQENGEPLDTGTPTKLFSKLLKRAGLRSTRLHDLRHLHATELLRLGEPLHVVSDRLGHRDPMVTATVYAHVSNEQGETASNTFAVASRSYGIS